MTTTLAGSLTNSAFNQKLQFSSSYTYSSNIAIGEAIAGGKYGVSEAIQNYRSKPELKSANLKVIGRLDDTAVDKTWKDHDLLDIPEWTIKKNREWVDQGIVNKQKFYTASPEA